MNKQHYKRQSPKFPICQVWPFKSLEHYLFHNTKSASTVFSRKFEFPALLNNQWISSYWTIEQTQYVTIQPYHHKLSCFYLWCFDGVNMAFTPKTIRTSAVYKQNNWHFWTWQTISTIQNSIIWNVFKVRVGPFLWICDMLMISFCSVSWYSLWGW